MTDEFAVLDDATRPKAPQIIRVTPAQRRHGRRLALFHAIHLRELDRVRLAIAQVETGAAATQELANAIDAMSMRDNLRLCGSLCGGACEMLTLHHMIEDQSLFPILWRGSNGLKKVVERLTQEHRAIHRLVEYLEAAASAVLVAADVEGFVALKRSFLSLESVVRSHFGYEETELEEAIGFYDAPL
jgi:iron-sulfur cluster repair protein YtfE (RIC family)